MSEEKNHKKPLFNIQRHYLISLLLVLTTIVVYFQVGQFEFLDYDDNLYVTENHAVKAGLSQKGLRWAFKAIYVANWHPLTWASHMVDVQLYGLNPGAHHFTNVLFHILNAILLFHFFRKITGTLWRSAFVAALFALHPLHVESVAWIAGRKDVLSTFFWLVTMLSYTGYVKQPTIWRYLPVMTFFALGLMVKPMVVTLPFVLLLLDYWPFGRLTIHQLGDNRGSGCQKKIFFRLVIEKIPLFILTIASCIVTFMVQSKGGAVESLIRFPLTDRMTNALVSYARYVLKMIWPSHLAVFYPHPGIWPLWQFAGAILFLALIFILVIKTYRKKPYLMVGWLWYIGTLVPVIGLVQVGKQAMADRYTYIPLIGLFVMIAWGAEELLKRWRYRSFGLATAGGPGRFDEAIAQYITVLRIDPYYTAAQKNLAVTLAKQRRFGGAINGFSETLCLNSEDTSLKDDLKNINGRKDKD